MSNDPASAVKRSIAKELLFKTAGYLKSAASEYTNSNLSVTKSTIEGAGSAAKDIANTLKGVVDPVYKVVFEMKREKTLKKIFDWYMNEAENVDSDTDDSLGASLSFDDLSITTDQKNSDNEKTKATLTEIEKSSNKVAKTVVESSHKLAEATITGMANVISATDKQTAVIASGFDNVNAKLDQVISLMKQQVAASVIGSVGESSSSRELSYTDAQRNMARGNFNWTDYKRIVEGNIDSHEFVGQTKIFMNVLNSFRDNLFDKPDELISTLFAFGMDQFLPNFGKSLKAIDDAFANSLKGSLVRLGSYSGDNSLLKIVSKIFGLDSTSRSSVDTSVGQLELKNIGFDTVTKEAIVHTIPGYLKEIVNLLGGSKSMNYDFKNRRFISDKEISDIFHKAISNEITGFAGNGSGSIAKRFNKNNFTRMLYDLMIEDLGRTQNKNEMIESFKSKDNAKEYVMDLLEGVKTTDRDKKSIANFISNLSKIDFVEANEILSQVYRANSNRSARAQSTIDEYKAMELRFDHIKDSIDNDRETIIKRWKRELEDEEGSTITGPVPFVTNGSGVMYTNIALYEIYRRLNEGINVFQVGTKPLRSNPFEKLDRLYLPEPDGYLSKPISDPAHPPNSADDDEDDEDYDVDEDGDGGGPSNSVSDKALKRGKDLLSAIVHGRPDEVRTIVSQSMEDVVSTIGNKAIDGTKTLNDSFGNVWGYVRHKFTGEGYTYDSGQKNADGSPKMITVAKNDKGGIFGYVSDKIGSMFTDTKKATSEWFNTVKGYFDFSGSNQTSDIKDKRKKLIYGSVGALAGSGILGGPIGMLAGAIAGVGLSTVPNLEKRIKEFLFGNDEKDPKKKKRGLIGSFMDNTLAPIRYELGKTFDRVAMKLRTRILGPLADLGFAIKDRILHVLTGQSNSFFGKLFGLPYKLAKKMFGPLFSFIGNITGKLKNGLISFAGSAARGILGGGMNLIGGTIAGLANTIVTSKNSKFLKDRQDARMKEEDDYRNDKEGKYYSLENWKKHQEESGDNTSLEEYTAEVQTEIRDDTTEIKDSVSDIRDVLLNGCIRSCNGGVSEAAAKESEAQNLKSAAITAASTISAGGDGSFSAEEAALTKSIIDSDSNAKPASLTDKLKKLINFQRKRGEGEGEDFISKIFGISKKLFAPLMIKALLAIAGIALLLNNAKKGWDSMSNSIGNISDALGNILTFLKGPGETPRDDQHPSGIMETHNRMADLMTAPLDIGMHGPIFAPWADIDHAKANAAGQYINNYAATRAFTTPATNIARTYAEYYAQNRLHGSVVNRGKFLGTNMTMNKHVGRFGIGVGLGGLAGRGVGAFVEQGAKAAGINDQAAGVAGRVSELATQSKVTWDLVRNNEKSLSMKALNKLKETVGKLPSLIAKVPYLNQHLTQKSITMIITRIMGFVDKLTVPVLQAAQSTVMKILAKAGINVTAGAATGGIVTAGFMAVGGAYQALNPENLFMVRKKDVSSLMVLISGAIGALFNFPICTLLELLDIVLVPSTGKSIRQHLAQWIYGIMESESLLDTAQDRLEGDRKEYNDKFGTDLDIATFNDMVNQSAFDAVMYGGAERDSMGRVQFADDGSVKRYGVGKLLSDFGESVSNYFEKRAPWKEEDESATIEDFTTESLDDVTYPMTNIFKVASDSVSDWLENDAPWAKDGSITKYIGRNLDDIFKVLGKKWDEMLKELEKYSPMGKLKEIGNRVSTGWNNVTSGASSWIEDAKRRYLGPRTGGGDSDGGFTPTKELPPQRSRSDGRNYFMNPLSELAEITAPFKQARTRADGSIRYHAGVDLAPSEVDDAFIVSTANGTIENTGYDSGYGNYVDLRTDQGDLMTFAHMEDNSIPPGIRIGARVKPGDKLGIMGDTGNSFGPHLHYEIEDAAGNLIDPTDFLDNENTVHTPSSPDGVTTGGAGGTFGPGGGRGSNGATSSGGSGPMSFIDSIISAGQDFLHVITGGIVPKANQPQVANNPSSGFGYPQTNIKFSDMPGTENIEKMYNYFRRNGLSPAASAGILGNFGQESGFDPTRYQDDGGPGRGLAQWEYHPDGSGRFTGLEEYAASINKPWTDMDAQLGFTMHELTTDDMDLRLSGDVGSDARWLIQRHGYEPLSQPGYENFRNIADPLHATALFEGAFERSGEPHMETRYAYAESIFNEFNKTPGASPLTSPPPGEEGKGYGKEESRTGGVDVELPSIKQYDTPNYSPSMPRTGGVDVVNPVEAYPRITNNTDVRAAGEEFIYKIESLLEAVLNELRAINGNTGNSNNLLTSLNEKEFVDTGVRSSLKALGNVKHPKKQLTNYQATRSIKSIIRP